MPPFGRDDSIDKTYYKPRVVGSLNKNQTHMDDVLHAMSPLKLERVAGSGNKYCHMVDNKTDYYINLVPGMKTWDLCGSEAILAARFGIVTDA